MIPSKPNSSNEVAMTNGKPKPTGAAKKKKKPPPSSSEKQQQREPTVATAKKAICKYPLDPKDVSANWLQLQRQFTFCHANKVFGKKAIQKPKQLKEPNKKVDHNKRKKKKKASKVVVANGTANHQLIAGASTPNGNSAAADVWFDNVDPCLIKSSMISSANGTVGTANKLCKETSFDGLTRFVAMDCEMVGAGFNGSTSILARVSIVNLYGHCVYDKFVKPTEEVTDYRTEVSGIRPENLVNADDFKTVQKEVFEIIRGRVLVGHAIQHDLKVLFLSQPKHMIRDTSVYFRRFFNRRTPSLKKLTEDYLGVQIQHGEHDSITDAQATMRLYTLFKKEWESEIHSRSKKARGKRNQESQMLTATGK